MVETHACWKISEPFPYSPRGNFNSPFQFARRGNRYAFAVYDKPLLDKYRINVQYGLLFYYWPLGRAHFITRRRV